MICMKCVLVHKEVYFQISCAFLNVERNHGPAKKNLHGNFKLHNIVYLHIIVSINGTSTTSCDVNATIMPTVPDIVV